MMFKNCVFKVSVDTKKWAQTHLGKNSHKLPESYGIKNPLAGIVVCSCCGKKMMRRPASKTPGGASYDVLKCNTRNCPTIGSALGLVDVRSYRRCLTG